MDAVKWTPSELARQARTTPATISNWLTEQVQPQHIKAEMLFNIAKALRVNPEWLLSGELTSDWPAYSWAPEIEPSHPVSLPTLTIALRLAAEALNDGDMQLPPSKHAELVGLVYELLVEGLPEAKVLKFARAAAA